MASHLDEVFAGYGDRLDVKDVCTIFGVSEPTVRRWLIKGELPGYQSPGGGWLILTAEVREWVRARSNQDR